MQHEDDGGLCIPFVHIMHAERAKVGILHLHIMGLEVIARQRIEAGFGRPQYAGPDFHRQEM